MKKSLLYINLLILPFFLSSCDWVISWIGNLMCSLAPDSDHCFQFSAVQWWNPDICSKIKWTKFKDTWSNPPRDKCYLQIAVNKWDYSVCNNIKWWPMSYSVDWCIQDTWNKIISDSDKNDDINWCNKLSKFPSAYSNLLNDCKAKLATVEKINSKDSKIENLISQLKKDPDNSELKKQLTDLKKQKELTYNMMNEADKWKYFSAKREEIMAWIEDEDVKSAISKEYINYRASDSNINNQLDKLQEITKKQELIKSADEKANQLMDQMKEQLDWLVKDKQDEIVWAMWDKAKDWIEKNWWDSVKYALNDLKWAMDKYEKWSKMYEDAKSKYDKLNKVYTEVMWVYNRVDEVNKMLAEWKIDAGKAKVLKWAVLLDKWLEYATEYVPVFWSTISTISKETFWTVIELAKKRAERSTALDKCFTDPANCDTDKISAY